MGFPVTRASFALGYLHTLSISSSGLNHFLYSTDTRYAIFSHNLCPVTFPSLYIRYLACFIAPLMLSYPRLRAHHANFARLSAMTRASVGRVWPARLPRGKLQLRATARRPIVVRLRCG